MKTVHVVTGKRLDQIEILGAFTTFPKASEFARREDGATIHECRVNDTEGPIARTWELKQSA